jgi:hypothetical protein
MLFDTKYSLTRKNSLTILSSIKINALANIKRIYGGICASSRSFGLDHYIAVRELLSVFNRTGNIGQGRGWDHGELPGDGEPEGR